MSEYKPRDQFFASFFSLEEVAERLVDICKDLSNEDLVMKGSFAKECNNLVTPITKSLFEAIQKLDELRDKVMEHHNGMEDAAIEARENWLDSQ